MLVFEAASLYKNSNHELLMQQCKKDVLMYWGTKYKPLRFIFLLKGSKIISPLLHGLTATWEMLWDLRSATILFYDQKHAVQYGIMALKSVCGMLALVCCVKSVDRRTFSSCIRVLLGRDSRHSPLQHLSRLFLMSNKCMCPVTYQEEKSANSHQKDFICIPPQLSNQAHKMAIKEYIIVIGSYPYTALCQQWWWLVFL